MAEVKTLDTELSRYLAENIFRVRKAVAIKGFEDVLLLRQFFPRTDQSCDPPSEKGGVLRLSRKGVFVYGVSKDEKDFSGTSGNAYMYTYTDSPLLGGHSGASGVDEDGIKLAWKDLAKNYYDKDGSTQVLEDGTLVVPKNVQEKLLTNFIERFTPSSLKWGVYNPHMNCYVGGLAYDQSGNGFPGCDSWSKLGETEKRVIVEKLIDRVERAFLLKTPEVYNRVRFKK